MERSPTAEFAPVITNTPPLKSFDSMVLPLSRDRAELTRFLRVGQSSISGSIRWRRVTLGHFHSWRDSHYRSGCLMNDIANPVIAAFGATDLRAFHKDDLLDRTARRQAVHNLF